MGLPIKYEICISLVLLICVVHCGDSRRCIDESKPAKARVAVCFWGLSRNLLHTLPYYNKRVFQVLDEHNIAYDVFWNTVVSASISSERSSEFNAKLNMYDARMIEPCKVSISDQETVAAVEYKLYCKAKKWDKQQCSYNKWNIRNNRSLWSEEFLITRHLLCAYYTQNHLSTMVNEHMELTGIPYDAILALRPDMAPVTDIDLPQNLHAVLSRKNTIWIPNFQDWNGTNDRVAYGTPSVMTKYLTRGEQFRDLPEHWNNNSEIFLDEFLKRHKITVESSSFRSLRVRADGLLSPFDYDTTRMAVQHKSFSKCFYAKKWDDKIIGRVLRGYPDLCNPIPLMDGRHY